MSRPVYPVSDVSQVGPMLRRLRHGQDVTLLDVEDTMGAAVRQLSAWELNRKLIKLDRLIDLLAAYDYVPVFMHRDDVASLRDKTTRPS